MIKKLVLAAVLCATILVVAVLLIPRGKVVAFLMANAELTTVPVTENVYWVKGGIANAGIIVGDEGVIVIDAESFIKTTQNLKAEIEKITTKPVKTVILTHSDPDHVNGLPAFPVSIQVIAQENVAADIKAELEHPKALLISPPQLKDYFPSQTISDRADLTIDGVRLELLHVAPAHTDGDLVVFLPDQRIVFAGDILVPGITPYAGIHLGKRGSTRGWMQTMTAMLALDADIFISGHGEPMTREQVEGCLEATTERYDAIERLIAENKTVEEIKIALNEPKPKGVEKRFPTFVENSYDEIVGQNLGDPHD